MKNLEALVVHLLLSESFDIFSDEGEISLVGLDWVAQVILVDLFLVVSEERADGLDAGRALQVLGGKELVEVLLERRAASVGAHVQELEDSHEDLFEALEVPVLVNNGVNDSGKEDLLSLVCKQIEKVVHLVDGFNVSAVLQAPLWE